MTYNSLSGTASISAMELRKQPGTVLDRVFYNGESVVVKRANEPRAVLIPVVEYQKMQLIKMDSKKRLSQQIDKMKENASSLKPESVKKIINEALESTKQNVSPST